MTFNCSARNLLSKVFSNNYNKIIESNFSRNANIWKVFGSPDMSQLAKFQLNCYDIEPKPEQFCKDGKEIFRNILNETQFPKDIATPEYNKKIQERLNIIGAHSKNWASPRCVENVISYPCDSGVYGSMVGLLANANIVHYECIFIIYN